MDSFRTRRDTLEALAAHPGLAVDGLPLDFLQNQEPKLLVDDLTPVELAGRSRPRVVPARARRPLHRADTSGLLRRAARRGLPTTLSSPTPTTSAPCPIRAGRLVRRHRCAVRRRVLPAHPRRPQGRPSRRAKGRRPAGAAGDGADPPTRTRTRSPTSTGTATSTPTTCGWTSQALAKALEATDGVLGLPLIRNVKHVDPADPSTPGGDPDRDRDGRGGRGVRGRRRDRGRPEPVPAGEDDQRPARPALRCLRGQRHAQLVVPTARGRPAPLVDLDPAYYRCSASSRRASPRARPHWSTRTGSWWAGTSCSEPAVSCVEMPTSTRGSLGLLTIAPPRPLTTRTVDQHLARILDLVSPLPPYEQPLLEALGLPLCEDVVSGIDLPGFDNSAMDGYAVRSEDVVERAPSSRACCRWWGSRRPGRPRPTRSLRGQRYAS